MTAPIGVRGGVLIEAVVALAVLGMAGSAAAGSVSESLRAVARARAREDEVRRVTNLMTAVSLWPREDLDRHLGATAQGPWRLWVNRTGPVLYEVSIADSEAGSPPLLHTVLFRPDSTQ